MFTIIVNNCMQNPFHQKPNIYVTVSDKLVIDSLLIERIIHHCIPETNFGNLLGGEAKNQKFTKR